MPVRPPTAAQATLLRAVAAFGEEGAHPSAVAEAVGLPSANAASHMRGLEAKGWLVSVDEHPARTAARGGGFPRRYYRVTGAGQAVLRELGDRQASQLTANPWGLMACLRAVQASAPGRATTDDVVHRLARSRAQGVALLKQAAERGLIRPHPPTLREPRWSWSLTAAGSRGLRRGELTAAE